MISITPTVIIDVLNGSIPNARIEIIGPIRKKKQLKEQQPALSVEHAFHTDTPLNSLMNKELKTLLEKAVSALPEKYRMVFVMREIEGMSMLETMDVLNLNESNVKVRLNRAKEMLRNDLESYYRSYQLFDFNLVRCDRVVQGVMGKLVVR